MLSSIETIRYFSGELIAPCPENQCYIVLEGVVEVRIGNRTYALSDGDCLPEHRHALCLEPAKLGLVSRDHYQSLLDLTPYAKLSLRSIWEFKSPQTFSLAVLDI